MQVSNNHSQIKKEKISKVTGKEFSKFQHSFTIKKKKTTSKPGIEGKFVNLGKGIYQKPTSVIIFSDVKNIPYEIRNKTKMATVATFI